MRVSSARSDNMLLYSRKVRNKWSVERNERAEMERNEMDVQASEWKAQNKCSVQRGMGSRAPYTKRARIVTEAKETGGANSVHEERACTPS